MPEDNRSRLLNLAADLFAAQGYAEVSVRDLAGRLDLTTGAIYSNFRSKGDLLAEVLDRRIRVDMERSRPDVALPEFVRQSFQRMRDRTTMRALLVEAAVAARTDPELRAQLNPTLGALVQRWIADYRDWQHVRHVHRRHDMDALVRALWAIELGLGVLQAQGALKANPARLAEFVGAYLDSIEASERPRAHEARAPDRLARRSKRRPAQRESEASAFRLTPVAALRDSPRAVATQWRLIETAIELFATRGYSGVTVRDLARASAMTTGSIYGNFANKAFLLVEAIEARIAADLEQLPPELVASGSPAELVVHNLGTFDARRQLRALLLEGAVAARSDPEVHGRLEELQERHLQVWTAGVDDWAVRSGATPAVDARTAITAVWSAELGLGLLEAFGLATPPASVLADTFGAMFSVSGFADSSAAPRRSRMSRTAR